MKTDELYGYHCCLVTKSCPTLCDPMDCSMLGSSVHRICQAIILEWVAISSANPRILPNPRIELGSPSPALLADSLPAEPPGKPKNTRVSSLSLLQQILPTQEWNQGVLHCRRILYKLSYQGSPILSPFIQVFKPSLFSSCACGKLNHPQLQ